MCISVKGWKSVLLGVLAMILVVILITSACAFAESPVQESPQTDLEATGWIFLGSESDPDGKAYLETRARIETKISEYLKKKLGLSVEEFTTAMTELARISTDELSAYYEKYTDYSLSELSRIEQLESKYGRMGGLGFGNETVKGIPKAELLTRLFKEWELEVLKNERTCFWNSIDVYTKLRSSDGRYVTEIFENLSEKVPYFAEKEIEDEWRENWLNFLDQLTVDEYGYFHVLSPDGEDLRLLGGINARTWFYSEEDFKPEYLVALPYSDRGIFN